MRTILLGTVFMLSFAILSARPAEAQPAVPSILQPEASRASQDAGGQDADGQDGDAKVRNERLAKYLSGKKFVGQFTVIGSEQKTLPKDEYHLLKVEKLPQGDLFMIHARIKYGEKDVTVPLPIPIRWAGKVPVISLDDFTIPGMGTFSSNIVISNGRYAGTWRHDDKGGHMFGVIEAIDAAKSDDGSDDKSDDDDSPGDNSRDASPSETPRSDQSSPDTEQK